MSVYLDIDIGPKRVGRVVLRLYDEAPRAKQNFTALCLAKAYAHVIFHRIVRNYMLQAGDTTHGKKDSVDSDKIGTGGASTFGEPFPDENLGDIAPFRVCMANSGPNTNTSQFFISTNSLHHLRGKHTVFGEVTHGKSVLREMENTPTDRTNFPTTEVVIADCGVWSEGDDVPIFNASYDPIGGDVYEEYPDDDNHIDKKLTESALNAATTIKGSGDLLLKKGDRQNALFKYKKAMRYIMEYIPDRDDEPDNYARCIELKKKIYLNSSLACLQVQEYPRCVEYCEYLLDFELSPAEEAKTYFRRGSSYHHLKQYKEALKDLQRAHELVPTDEKIAGEIKKCEDDMEREKQKEKKKYLKFFG